MGWACPQSSYVPNSGTSIGRGNIDSLPALLWQIHVAAHMFMPLLYVNASLALFTRSFLSSTLFIFNSQLNGMEKSNWDLKNYLNYTNLQVTLLMLATSALHCQSLLVLSFTGYELFSFIFLFFIFILSRLSSATMGSHYDFCFGEKFIIQHQSILSVACISLILTWRRIYAYYRQMAAYLLCTVWIPQNSTKMCIKSIDIGWVFQKAQTAVSLL